MDKLTNMPKNYFTTKLIDIIMAQKTSSLDKQGLFLVMEYIESDLKKVYNSIPEL